MIESRSFISWGPDLELGIPILDEQHRSLVDLANKLFEAVRKDKASEEARAAIARLFAYSATHFADEEAYFQRYNFPSQDRHAATHAAFIARASEFEERLASGSPVDASEILEFLRGWIRRHIAREDRELARLARGQES
jgi:hemerythrin